jgi:hypothetical protein
MSSEAPEPVLTLKQRIAALQLAQAADNEKRVPAVTVAPVQPPERPRIRKAATEPAAPPPLPSRPSQNASTAVARVVPRPSARNAPGNGNDEPPPMPRRPSQQQPPALPPRRPSAPNDDRRLSTASATSTTSNRSSISAASSRTANTNPNSESRFPIKAPAAGINQNAVRRNLPSRAASMPIPPRALSAPAKSLPAPQRPSAAQQIVKEEEEAPPPPMPARPTAAPTSPLVELKANTFDDVVLRSGKPVFVDFYAPFCKCTRTLSPLPAVS